ncbi:unnamed protein product [Dibothriocephalus latus]|uniref:rRNA adenine N(6)-methyltransferase n=1 Tax=Dibothriocephalus latus TaxID=60516 RepID=A0A3P7LIH6_DIBLA|nr:unnamed protein product [Dibothriocephalus latus]
MLSEKAVMTLPLRNKLEIIVGDVIKATKWPKFDLCVANLPYQISSPFIGRLISAENHFRAAVVMLQKEFADRLLAAPGSKIYCRLSANAQFHFKIAQLIKSLQAAFIDLKVVGQCAQQCVLKPSVSLALGVDGTDGLRSNCYDWTETGRAEAHQCAF